MFFRSDLHAIACGGADFVPLGDSTFLELLIPESDCFKGDPVPPHVDVSFGLLNLFSNLLASLRQRLFSYHTLLIR